MKNFIENFERDKELAEIRALKYYKEAKERNVRIANHITETAERRKKEIDDELQQNILQKQAMIQKFKEKEKAITLKRLEENKSKLLKVKSHIKEKPARNVNKYLYSIKSQDYIKKEANEIQEAKRKRKLYMKSISKAEIRQFSKEYEENIKKFDDQQEIKKKKLIKEWHRRKISLPNYVSPSYENVKSDNRKEIENEETKKEKIEQLNMLRKNYSMQIKNEKQPIINIKLQQKRLEQIKQLENPTLNQKDHMHSENTKSKILLKKGQLIKPPKITWKLKLELDNNEFGSPEINIKKPKKIKFSSVFTKHETSDKKIDYLKENYEKGLYVSNKKISEMQKKKWNKILENVGNDRTVIMDVKNEADFLEQKAKRNEVFMRLNGGLTSNPELGQKITELLVDSIEAKLSILEKVINSD